MAPTAIGPKGVLLRGVALVEQIIALVEPGNADIDVPDAHPVPAKALAKLRIGDTPPPPSLLRWLAFDGSWWMQETHHFHDLARPRLQPISIAALTMRELAFVSAPTKPARPRSRSTRAVSTRAASFRWSPST